MGTLSDTAATAANAPALAAEDTYSGELGDTSHEDANVASSSQQLRRCTCGSPAHSFTMFSESGASRWGPPPPPPSMESPRAPAMSMFCMHRHSAASAGGGPLCAAHARSSESASGATRHSALAAGAAPSCCCCCDGAALNARSPAARTVSAAATAGSSPTLCPARVAPFSARMTHDTAARVISGSASTMTACVAMATSEKPGTEGPPAPAGGAAGLAGHRPPPAIAEAGVAPPPAVSFAASFRHSTSAKAAMVSAISATADCAPLNSRASSAPCARSPRAPPPATRTCPPPPPP